MKASLIFVICTFFAVSYAQTTCATTDCGGYACCEDEVRGPACIYQPDLYTCASGIRLCPTGYGVCNTGCFDQTLYYCSNNVLYQLPASATVSSGSTGSASGSSTTGNAPVTACGSIAADCGSYQCCNDSVTGFQCVYQPDLYTCFQNIRLCSKGDGVCNTVCYDASNYICVNGVITQIPTTGGSATATKAPTAKATVPATTKAPTQSPTTTKAPTQSAPTTKATSAPTPTASSVPTCANTDCGGFQCCPDEVLGPVCIYQPTLYTCASGVRLCGAGDGVCGTACYDASMYTCESGVITQK